MPNRPEEAPVYAFVCRDSACEALRTVSARDVLSASRWPSESRALPFADCVSNQADFKRLCREVDLGAYGVRSRPAHLLVPSQRRRSSGKGAVFHVWSSSLPAGSCLRMGEKVLLCGPEFTVIQLCGATAKLEGLLDGHVAAVRAEAGTLRELGIDEEPVVDHPLVWEHARRLVLAAVVACEFAGTYRLGARGGRARYHVQPLMSMEGLRQMAGQLRPGAAATRAREVAELAFDGAASPMEASLALMLSLPVGLGGLGLPKPQLNVAIDVSSRRGVLTDADQVTPDFLWPEERVALEYDSGEFHAGEPGLGRDAARANTLTAMGYRVFRATPWQVRSLAGIELLGRQLARALGVALEAPSEVETLRRARLYAEFIPRREG